MQKLLPVLVFLATASAFSHGSTAVEVRFAAGVSGAGGAGVAQATTHARRTSAHGRSRAMALDGAGGPLTVLRLRNWIDEPSITVAYFFDL